MCASRERATPATSHRASRRPVSILVVVYTSCGHTLALKRRKPFDFWQSITGSLDHGEEHADAARRELFEETGLTGEQLTYTGVSRMFEIDPRWRHRFGPGITDNLEFEWRLAIDKPCSIQLNPNEHTEYEWLPLEAARDRFWSWTNKAAIDDLLGVVGRA